MSSPNDPPFAGTLPDNHNTYLGSVDVVERLVREFFYDVSMGMDIDTVAAAVNRYATIFCGADFEYQPVPGWNERLQLGVVMAARVGVDINQDWESIMRTALLGFALEIKQIIRQHADSPDDDWQWKVDGLIEFWTSLLVGTIDITHPEEED
jgi:hypothetical protein